MLLGWLALFIPRAGECLGLPSSYLISHTSKVPHISPYLVSNLSSYYLFISPPTSYLVIIPTFCWLSCFIFTWFHIIIFILRISGLAWVWPPSWRWQPCSGGSKKLKLQSIIIAASSGVRQSVPRVSYVSFLDIWMVTLSHNFSCTHFNIFIF